MLIPGKPDRLWKVAGLMFIKQPGTTVFLYRPLASGPTQKPLLPDGGGLTVPERAGKGRKGRRMREPLFCKKGVPAFSPSCPAPLLHARIGVAEDYPTVGAGLDHVASGVNFPSLCDEGVARIYHSGETGTELLESGHISVASLVQDRSHRVAVRAEPVKNWAREPSHFGKFRIDMQRIGIAIESI